MKRTLEHTQRGLIEYTSQPTRTELEALDSFSFYDGAIRVTFRKRLHGPENGRGKRRPTWEGFTSHNGRTLSAYAGTDKTFDLSKAVCKIAARVKD